VAPVPFADAARVAGFGLKGEFETTADYEARVRASGLERQFIVERVPVRNTRRERYISYNADDGELRVWQFAFSNEALNIKSALEVAGVPVRGAGIGEEVSATISQQDEVLGIRMARTRGGVPFEVTSIRRRVEAVFDRIAQSNTYGLFPEHPTSNPPRQQLLSPGSVGTTFRIALSRDDARRLMPGLRAAFVIETRAPYLVTVVHAPFTLSLDNPTDIEQHATVLVADIQCALLMDADGKVLLTVTTN